MSGVELREHAVRMFASRGPVLTVARCEACGWRVGYDWSMSRYVAAVRLAEAHVQDAYLDDLAALER